MATEIIVALITGGLALVGVLISNATTARRNESKVQIAQAVTDTKIDALTQEVRRHNDFARRLPVMEEQIKELKAQVSELREYHK